MAGRGFGGFAIAGALPRAISATVERPRHRASGCRRSMDASTDGSMAAGQGGISYAGRCGRAVGALDYAKRSGRLHRKRDPALTSMSVSKAKSLTAARLEFAAISIVGSFQSGYLSDMVQKECPMAARRSAFRSFGARHREQLDAR